MLFLFIDQNNTTEVLSADVTFLYNNKLGK